MNQKKQLMKNTIIIAIGKLSTQIISYLLLPLYSSKLTPAEYGNYDFICTLSIFLCPIITLLMEESMFRYLIDAESKVQRKKIISQTIIYTLLATLAFTILASLIMKLGTEYTNIYISAIILFVISNILLGLSNALSRGLGKIKLYSISNFILGITTIILNIVFILVVKKGAEGLLWANTIANSITAILVLIILKLPKYIGKLDKPIMKDMIKYSLPLVPNSISWSIINMSDRLILTQMVNSAANGIYAMANKFPNIINVLYGYFYTAWKESAAKIAKEENKNNYYNSIYHDAKRFLYAVTICLIAVMPFAFPIFINEAYKEAYIYIPIVMIATYYSNLSSFYGGIFSAYKDTKIMGTTTIVAAVLNLIIDIALVKFIGIYAACLSTILASLIVYFYRKKKLKKYMKLRELKWKGPMVFLAIICIAYYAKYIPSISNNMLLIWSINIISLLIAVLYSLANNWKFIKGIVETIKGKIKR